MRERNVPVEYIVKKLTSMPAEMYHLEGRGVLKAGMKADICLMDYENVKDQATFEDLYKDYETLGKIFKVEDVAAERVQTMKDTIQEVKDALGDEAYADPITVFAYDSGEDVPFTACQGMPGDIIKLAGGISIFDDIEAGWAKPSWEEVVDRDPDVILILDYTGDISAKKEFLETSEFTKDLRAVKEGRIYSACCSDMQGSAGSAEAVKIIAEQLYPDKF